LIATHPAGQGNILAWSSRDVRFRRSGAHPNQGRKEGRKSPSRPWNRAAKLL